jgi:hypothetical protein
VSASAAVVLEAHEQCIGAWPWAAYPKTEGWPMSSTPAWECQRSVDVDLPVSFAWRYMTDVGNWSDPPAEFVLEGSFAAGARGTTRMPEQSPHVWTIRDVDPGRGYTIEGGSFLDRAVLLFHWRFDSLSDCRTRLTQRVELRGDNAQAYVSDIRAGFEPNLEPGLRRIANLMTRAAQENGRQGEDAETAER